MKKIFNFFGVLLILCFVFACTLPSEVEVSGSPSLKFAANMNFGDCFTEMVENVMNADGKTKTLPCTNPSLDYLAFVLRMEICKKDDYKIDSSAAAGGTITINENVIIVSSTGTAYKVSTESDIAVSKEPYNLSFKGLENYLEGFEFHGIHSKIYLYGTELAEVACIELTRVKPDGSNETLIPRGTTIKKGPSGVENMEEFTGLELPQGGEDISDVIEKTINEGKDLTLNYKIYLEAGTEIDKGWIDKTHTITAELVIWLPMKFISIKENAVFKFPTFFNNIGDIIKSLSGTGCIEKMSYNIAIDPLNPFNSGLFIISDDGFGNKQNSSDENNFFIDFNKEEIDYINNNSFNPRFFVLYPKIGSTLDIPKEDIMITTVSFNADILYNVEL